MKTLKVISLQSPDFAIGSMVETTKEYNEKFNVLFGKHGMVTDIIYIQDCQMCRIESANGFGYRIASDWLKYVE